MLLLFGVEFWLLIFKVLKVLFIFVKLVREVFVKEVLILKFIFSVVVVFGVRLVIGMFSFVIEFIVV